MIDTKELQLKYINLYKQLRRYIWDYPSVRLLANLEISIFDRFPNLDEVYKYASYLKTSADRVTDRDSDVMKAFNDLFDEIESCSDSGMYVTLNQVREVI